jgi:hypothetical protein
MSVPDGYPLLLSATGLAVLTFAASARMRSWPLWLAGYLLTLLALGVAWGNRTNGGGVA